MSALGWNRLGSCSRNNEKQLHHRLQGKSDGQTDSFCAGCLPEIRVRYRNNTDPFTVAPERGDGLWNLE